MSLPYDDNTYRVTVLHVHDGDTFTGEIDLGMRVKITQVFRLEGLNAPEVVGKEKAAGLEAKAFLVNRLSEGKEVLVKTKKTEKYGRYVATVFCDGVNINEELIKNGFAKAASY